MEGVAISAYRRACAIVLAGVWGAWWAGFSPTTLAAPIHEAAAAKDAAKAAQILTESADAVRAPDEAGFLPIHIASASNAPEVVKLLLSKGADPGARTRQGRTPLWLAVVNKADAAARVLIEETQIVYTNSFLDIRTNEGKEARETGVMAEAYRLFTDLVRENPGNQRINFGQGLVCCSMGDFSRAQLAFDRVLQANPGHDRARAELAWAYVAGGQPAMAKREIEKVLARDLSPDVRKVLEGGLEKINRALSRWTHSIRIEGGGLSDDNVNIGPDSTLISIWPITYGSTVISNLTVSGSSQPTNAEGLFAAASLSVGYDFGERGGWSLMGDLAFYQNWLESDTAHESLFGQVGMGLKYRGTRNMFQFPVRAAEVEYGGDPLADVYGIYPMWQCVTTPEGNVHWFTAATVERRDYDTLNDRDSIYASLSETIRKYVGRRGHNVSIAMTVFYDNTRARVYENSGLAWTVGGEVALPWDFTAYARLRYLTSDYRERETLAPEERADTQVYVIAGVTKMLTKWWGLDANVQYTDNNSTFALYEYERNVLTAGTFVTF